MEKNQRYQKINQVFMVLYLLVCLWGIVEQLSALNALLYGAFSAFPLIFADSSVILEDTRLKPAYLVSLTVNLFSFLAFVIGIAFRGYGRLPFYDKAVHTLSGV